MRFGGCLRRSVEGEGPTATAETLAGVGGRVGSLAAVTHPSTYAYAPDAQGGDARLYAYACAPARAREGKNRAVGYRYGFNGKEDDDAFGYGVQDYGFRLYSPGIARFLSTDPLASSYPMLTPYQFASNRPIDGIDVDGLEYLTYVLNFYAGQADPVINIVHYDPENHRNYGSKGPGIQYAINQWTENGSKLSSNQRIFYPREQGLTTYGLYYGSKGLFSINRRGEFSSENDYTAPPIDAVDYGAWRHDRQYGAVGAAGGRSLFFDLASTPADEAAVTYWKQIVDAEVGDTDPFNFQPISKAEKTAAKRGVTLFGGIVSNKKKRIAKFISKSGISGAVPKSDDNYIETNYSIFVSEYFDKNESGDLIKAEGRWEVDADGEFIPNGSPLNPSGDDN